MNLGISNFHLLSRSTGWNWGRCCSQQQKLSSKPSPISSPAPTSPHLNPASDLFVYSSTNNGCPDDRGVIGWADVYGVEAGPYWWLQSLRMVPNTSRSSWLPHAIQSQIPHLGTPPLLNDNGFENTSRPWYGRGLRFKIRSHWMRKA